MQGASRSAIQQDLQELHRGITMHRLEIGSGFPALVFTVGCAAIFLIALPSLWYFLVFAATLGIGIAAVLRLFHD
jgi:hypothetical protein